jgi:TRAP-type mannitol/chloroaromatic compound transport system permease small subunit
MWLKKTAQVLEKVITSVIPVIGNIGAFFIVAAMLLTVADVIGRRFLDNPVPGSYEISAMMLVIVVFSTITYCQLMKGHVSIDILVSRLGQKTQDIINSIVYVIFLVIYVILTWQLYVYAIETFHKNEVSGTILLPVYPFVFIAAIGCTLLSLVVLMHLSQYLVKMVEK